MWRLSRLLKLLATVYVLLPAVVAAAMALSYYSYRYARQMARSGEQSILETTSDLADEKIARIEHLIVDSDQTLFNLVDLEDLQAFPRRWQEIGRLSPTTESVLIVDDRLRIAPDGYVSKRPKAEADALRLLFETRILGDLGLARMGEGEHRHVHKEYDGRYYLLSYTRRDVRGRPYYVVLDGDLAHLVGEVFPRYFAGISLRRVYQVVDEHDNVVFGHPFRGVPSKYMVSQHFPTTLWAWRLRMAPREAKALAARETTRRAFDVVLIGLSAATVFVGLAVLTLAIRHERRANQLKSDFIANVSHELKTPLSLIRMFGELLASGRIKGTDAAREYAGIITRESERLSRLIDNVLDFARIERGKAAYRFQAGDLAEVVSVGLDVYRHRLEREGMKLSLEIEPKLPLGRMDANAMTLVLLNLVDNAVKYAAEGKELAVSLACQDDRLVLSVADRGPGIEQDERDRIFERFYRSRRVRGRLVRGSGIGLSLVKHIAEAHDGQASVEARPGGGSVFTVWIPVARDEGGEAGAAPEEWDSRAEGGER